jgi:hypothetical protein
MPNQETRILDDIIASRRALLVSGGAALAALALPKPAKAAATVSTYTDNDILNFALNLEYLEANFYYLAAFGTTIDMTQTFSGASMMPINGVLGNNAGKAVNTAVTSLGNTTAGVPALFTGTAISNKVPFTNSLIAAYAQETAIEEGKHVAFLRGQLGSLAVAQPVLNLTVANFTALANAAGISGTFNPYLNDAFFLIGAYIFEDVGVSAYHGAAPLITNKATVLAAAAGIHAVEAYHAGLVRTTLTNIDAAGTFAAVGTLTQLTKQISNLRQTLASNAAVLPSPTNPEDPQPDDYGIATQNVTLGSSSVTASQIVDADPKMVTGFARSTTQVLNIVTGGGAQTSGATATGIFYPNGLNGLFI